MAPTATQSVNAKPDPGRRRAGADGIGVSWKASAIQTSAPPVRIVGAVGRYRGGYRVEV
jgi:hypothetical protein